MTPASGHEGGPTAVHWRHSLRTRLVGWFGLMVGLLLMVVMLSAYLLAERVLVADARARTRFEAQQTADELAANMESMRRTGEGVIALFAALELDRDALIRAMKTMLANDAVAVGGLLAVDAGILPDGQPLAFYAGVPERGTEDSDLIGEAYDYRSKDWYQRTVTGGVAWWSEPYFNETAGGIWITTLNLPLRLRDGPVVGLVSVDVPIRRLGEHLDPLMQVPGQRPSLLAPGGTFATHWAPGLAFKATTMDFINRGRTDLAPLEQARQRGERMEMEHRLPTGEKRFSVVEPVGKTGWSLHISLSQEAVLEDLRRSARWLAFGGVLAASVFALLILRLSRRITVPLSELAGSAGHFANGEFDWPVPHDARRDEVGVMARALERARDSIRVQLDEIASLASERQKLESELDIARDIQRAMLPPNRTYDGLGLRAEVHATLEPAKAVGGDFYNHFDQGDGRLWFLIGDVSDKGVPAALFMARTTTVLEVAAQLAGSPDLALAEAARHLVDGNDTCMFATVLCGRIDLGNGELLLASAGHEAPVRLRADGGRELLAFAGGGPLGFEAEGEFPLWTGRLAVGDTLVLYTDGVTEAFDPDNQPFSDHRLLEALDPRHDARAQAAALVAAAHAFAGTAPQSDDITVLTLKLAQTVSEQVPRNLL